MHYLFSLLLFVPTVSAHQPRIVNQVYATETVPISVSEPTISKAYYGDLKGEPEYYRIYSQEPFTLYVGILVPEIEGVDTDVSAEVLSGGTYGDVLYELKAENAQWEQYYEEHGGDTYFVGPELKEEGGDTVHPKGVSVEPGTYVVKVFSQDNSGKYVLVIGDTESFPPGEMLRTLLTLPKLKVYFEKSPFAAYVTKTSWMFIAVFVVPLALVAGGTWWWMRKKKHV